LGVEDGPVGGFSLIPSVPFKFLLDTEGRKLARPS
jgi:hypothetical protein